MFTLVKMLIYIRCNACWHTCLIGLVSFVRVCLLCMFCHVMFLFLLLLYAVLLECSFKSLLWNKTQTNLFSFYFSWQRTFKRYLWQKSAVDECDVKHLTNLSSFALCINYDMRFKHPLHQAAVIDCCLQTLVFVEEIV